MRKNSENRRASERRSDRARMDQPRSFPHQRAIIAETIVANHELLLRRIRGKLRARQVGTLVDAEDIFASAWRRIDAAVAAGEVKLDTPGHAIAYFLRTADNVATDRARESKREQCARNQAGRSRAGRPGAACEPVAPAVEDLASSVPGVAEREVILWKARGLSYSEMAALSGKSEEALRAAWSRACRTLVGRAPARFGCHSGRRVE